MNDTTMHNPDLGRAMRDLATGIVLENSGEEFQRKAVDCILRVWAGREGTGEDFRLACEREDIRPHHANAWGALILSLKRQGHLAETGEWRSMRDSKSHARMTRVYRVEAKARENHKENGPC
jgi:hypothetical protein